MKLEVGNSKNLAFPQSAVALIVFRRPETTRKVLDKVVESGVPRLYVIADGPRASVMNETQQTQEVRRLFDGLDSSIEVTRIYAEENLGLRKRVLSGLDKVFSQEERLIILEDDCLPSADFFRFCDEALERYADEPRVAMVSGNNFATRSATEAEAYFTNRANIWGWASWADQWRDFRSAQDDEEFQHKRRDSFRKLRGELERRNFKRLLDDSESLDSWAVDFAAHILTAEKFSLTPPSNLVRNIGFGESSTHTRFESWVDDIETWNIDIPIAWPTKIELDEDRVGAEARARFARLILFPIRHPFRAFERIFRYVKLILTRA